MRATVQLPSQLSANLKSLRKARGLSQSQLGKLLGVGQVRVANIEADPGAISVEQFMKILSLLGARMELALGSEPMVDVPLPNTAGVMEAGRAYGAAPQTGSPLKASKAKRSKPVW